MQKNFLFKALGFFAAVLYLTGTVYADIWVKDPISGCEVWSDDDGSAGEVPTWTGSCFEGKAIGYGTLVVHDKDGLFVVYKGEMRNGKVDGTGYLRFRSEETGKFNHYLGNFEDGKPMGNGIYDSSEGWRVQGWFDGALDTCEGSLTVEKDNAVIRGKFKDGKLVGSAIAYYQNEKGEYYFGDIEDGKRHGTGTLVHANDDAYVGDFENGVASGVGAYEANAGGGVVVGIFKDGKPNGPGAYLAPNGDSYQGNFKDGKLDGMVLITKEDGTQLTENWENGEKQQ